MKNGHHYFALQSRKYISQVLTSFKKKTNLNELLKKHMLNTYFEKYKLI